MLRKTDVFVQEDFAALLKKEYTSLNAKQKWLKTGCMESQFHTLVLPPDFFTPHVIFYWSPNKKKKMNSCFNKKT